MRKIYMPIKKVYIKFIINNSKNINICLHRHKNKDEISKLNTKNSTQNKKFAVKHCYIDDRVSISGL